MALSQGNRLSRVTTAARRRLSDVRAASARRETSLRSSASNLDLVHEETEQGTEPTLLRVNDSRQRVTVEVHQRDENSRFFSASSRTSRRATATGGSPIIKPSSCAVLAPDAACAQPHLPARHRADILKKVLEGLNVEFEIQGLSHPRDY